MAPDDDDVGGMMDPVVAVKLYRSLTLKGQEKNASENVVCWSRLLQIIA